MPLSTWSIARLAIVAILWIALVAFVGPRIGPRPSKWTMTAPDGTVQLSGGAYPASRDHLIALVAFGPPVVLVVLWWLQRR